MAPHFTKTLYYFTPKIRKGNMKRVPMNLKMISIENPMILNGNKISQINGNRNKRTIARGQHSTKRMHQRINEISVFIKEDSNRSLQLFDHF
jgi:hypothetical protein